MSWNQETFSKIIRIYLIMKEDYKNGNVFLYMASTVVIVSQCNTDEVLHPDLLSIYREGVYTTFMQLPFPILFYLF